MALYRTYRPATFAEVVGQEHVTDPLSRALDSGRINHAYLFSGPRGCGKTSSARILARSLNCVQGPTSAPCGECSSCVALAPGGPGNLDVVELDAASHGGVDDTRELRDRAFYAPAESRYRVFIIDEAHMVSSAGFNALLKIVEEPPEHLIFIFATTEPEKVLTTIRSRTHHYPFRLLAPPVMRGLLENICGREGVTVASEVFPLVIRAGGGSPRDSLSILDQLLAGAGPEGVTYDRALSLLGVTDAALIDGAVDALAAGDGAALFGVVERVVDAGHDPRRFAIDLLDRFRDLLLLQAVPDAAERGLVEAPADQVTRMRSVIDYLGLATLTRYAEVAHAALGEMRGTTSPRLLLEVMCARLLLPAASADDAALLQRLDALERRPGAVASGSAAPAAPAAESTPAAPAADEPPSRFVRPSQRRAHDETPPAAPAVDSMPPAPEPVVPAPVEPEAAEPASPVEAAQPEPPVQAEPPVPQPEPAAATPEPVAAEPEPVAVQESPPEPVASEPVVPEPVVPQTPRRPEPPVSAAPPVAEAPQEPHPSDPYADIPPPPDEPYEPHEVPPEGVVPPRPAPAAQRAPEPAAPEPMAAEPAAPEPVAAEPAPAEPAPAEPAAPEPAAAALTVESVSARWPDIRAAIRSRPAGKVLEPMLSAATVQAVGDGSVVLGHNNPPLVGRLSEPARLQMFGEIFTEIFGGQWQVQVVHAQSGPAPAAAANRQNRPPQQPRQTFTRPSRPGPAADRRPPDDVGPPPPEPPPEPEEPWPAEPVPDEELTDAERDEMVANVHQGTPDARLDPDQVALELLKSELGARPVDEER
ncbi:DNA polymerase III subunit gamma and tau [Gordonia caeni]|uniref:DNA polymerase III subunit gamma and tau n=1 Tax=Gordonia caeni TaxID=1007097 RepID=UPI0031D82738